MVELFCVFLYLLGVPVPQVLASQAIGRSVAGQLNAVFANRLSGTAARGAK